ncbi:MAG: DUF550 domain-containing protein [Ignavibacteria bacterium]|nr:DUF550 domain-containing protein [Ignavibacteria bacterium]
MNEALFNDIVNFQTTTFPNATLNSKLCHLREEMFELYEACNIKNGNVEDEFADCFLLLTGAFHKAGFNFSDIERIIRHKLKINKQRKWQEPDTNGVVKHIKE